MAREQGARSQLAAAFETVYGTAPASGYKRLPFVSDGLGAEQPLLESELLGYGRDPLAPIKDAVTVDGDIVVPMDAEAMGVWLKGALGAPVTTGTTPKIHTFNSGSYDLPSLSLEKQMPTVPYFAMRSGVKVNTLSWSMVRSGLLTMTVGLIAQGESKSATTVAGTLTDYALQRFGHFNGAIKRDTLAMANIISAEINYSNNLDRVETIRADGKIDGLDPGMAMLSGSFVARFDSETLLDQAINGTPCELEFSHVIGANASFKLTVHAVYLPRPDIPIEGPQGIQATFNWMAARAVSPSRMCTAVLTNTVATY